MSNSCTVVLNSLFLFPPQDSASKQENSMWPQLWVCLPVRMFLLRSLLSVDKKLKSSFLKAMQRNVLLVEMAQQFGWNLWITRHLLPVFWSTEMAQVALHKWTGWLCNLYLLALYLITASLNSWSGGTNCKRIAFEKVRFALFFILFNFSSFVS